MAKLENSNEIIRDGNSYASSELNGKKSTLTQLRGGLNVHQLFS